LSQLQSSCGTLLLIAFCRAGFETTTANAIDPENLTGINIGLIFTVELLGGVDRPIGKNCSTPSWELSPITHKLKMMMRLQKTSR
jgi:hypothetical protein